ncbi:NTP transferase domain-containing protein [Paenibacillus provencensis]|uniref:NTP transferase domain-containing protein n=1 Tax=Paenibacillus provencensis TaxID=441151 RepID=A0ABW3PW76_9BACL|nr:NTP transferase domain-containing protein [Paenibacillus sp. MER 78]MCM3128278.1 NTP transferase domain-containing protein [Paenibacillus sp. MER 78]
MSISKTVVINSAGVGSRLGMGTTKSLIEIMGKPLIEWQLQMLSDIQDIRVVVGFQAKYVIETVCRLRKDVTFVFNHDYLSTKTGTSLALGSRYTQNMILSLDGDLLIHPDDLKMILQSEDECIGYCEKNTEDPVLVTIEKDESEKEWATSFSRTSGNFEWTGLVQTFPESIKKLEGHVYQIIEGNLPYKAIKVRCQEIDTPSDYDLAIDWIKNNLI